MTLHFLFNLVKSGINLSEKLRENQNINSFESKLKTLLSKQHAKRTTFSYFMTFSIVCVYVRV